MTDFSLVDPRGWEYDLQSVYSAYIGYFQHHGIPWYERSWGHLFASFGDFLAFSWPVITVTDSWTSRAHIVTRMTSIGAFLKMIKTRFGETLPVVDNMLKVTPFENTQRHLRRVSDWQTYKKIHSTLPAIILASLKSRVKAGEPQAIQNLWDKKEKTFLAIDFEWSERNTSSALEWGYAAVRCGHLQAQGHWPPVPENYRKGHYIVAEYVDKVINRYRPTYPWHYAFGDSQVISKVKLPQIIEAVITSLASPDSETVSNNLVLVGHGISGDLTRLEEMKIKIPTNMLIIDTATFERTLFSSGLRHVMTDPKTNKPRVGGTTLSLENLIRTLPVDVPCQYHNSGNDAFMCLFALQKLLDPEHTEAPVLKKTKNSRFGPPQTQGANPKAMGRVGPMNVMMPVPVPVPVPVPTLTGMMASPISMVPMPMSVTPGINVTPAPANPGEDYMEAGNIEAAAQVRRLPGRARVSSSPGVSNANAKSPGANTHVKRHSGGGQGDHEVKNGGRGAGAPSADHGLTVPMRAMTLK